MAAWSLICLGIVVGAPPPAAPPPAAPTCASYSLINDTGLVVQSSLIKQVTATSTAACCAACGDEPTCAAFTYSPEKSTCRLTATPTAHGPVPGVISGRNGERTPTPPPTPPTPPPAPTPPPGVCVPVTRPPAPAPSAVPLAKRPNFVTLLIDDLGYDDLRSHDDTGAPFTPNAEALMAAGVRLGRHHSYMWCSPTRRSFLTGRYPVHITGVQAGTNTNLTPLQFTLVSEKLAAADYESHFIGKGHLGWHTTDHLLVNRGFHSHVGYLGGSQSYVCGVQDKSGRDGCDVAVGKHDMWHNATPGFDIVPEIQYSTNWYTEYAIERIRQRNASRPFWLHVAYQAMHGGTFRQDVLPWEALPNGTGFRDTGYGNALRALDDGIGNITAALKAAGMWENTLMVVVADNGGDNPGGAASNWPLVGRKCLSWEGGTRVYGLASGGLIPAARHGSSTAQLMHISDWHVTFSTLAGVDPRDDWRDPLTGLTHALDGVNVMPALLSDSAPTREWLPTTHKSLLWDQTATSGKMWKLIQGNETKAKRFHENGSTCESARALAASAIVCHLHYRTHNSLCSPHYHHTHTHTHRRRSAQPLPAPCLEPVRLHQQCRPGRRRRAPELRRVHERAPLPLRRPRGRGRDDQPGEAARVRVHRADDAGQACHLRHTVRADGADPQQPGVLQLQLRPRRPVDELYRPRLHCQGCCHRRSRSHGLDLASAS